MVNLNLKYRKFNSEKKKKKMNNSKFNFGKKNEKQSKLQF